MNIPNDIIKSKKKIEDFFEPSSEFEREYQKRYDDELDTCPNYPISYCILQDVFKRVFDNYRFYGPSANQSDIEFTNLENLFNEATYIAENTLENEDDDGTSTSEEFTIKASIKRDLSTGKSTFRQYTYCNYSDKEDYICSDEIIFYTKDEDYICELLLKGLLLIAQDKQIEYNDFLQSIKSFKILDGCVWKKEE